MKLSPPARYRYPRQTQQQHWHAVLFAISALILGVCAQPSVASKPQPNYKPAPYSLSAEQIQTFRRDGVIVVRGLLRGRELDDATKAAKRIQQSRSQLNAYSTVCFLRIDPFSSKHGANTRNWNG
mmetsp:Transcript_33905/g.99915  ORF Transcript_33905/g.99915 Transcript_33905/m.99915 type:complete len:125 (-) Transcript_33905:807-1181(-)